MSRPSPLFTFTLLLLFAVPVRAQGPAHSVTIQDGRWSDPNIWNGGVPAPADEAEIRHKVLLDVSTTVATLNVASGSLTPAGGRQLLRVDGSVVTSCPDCRDPLELRDGGPTLGPPRPKPPQRRRC